MSSARLTDEEYQFVYSRAPRLCVDLLIGDAHGIILSRRDIVPFPGLWHFPGGRVFYKESIAAAAARIAEAELGITIALEGFLGYIEMMDDGAFAHSVSLVLPARKSGGTLRGSAQAKAVQSFKTIPMDTHPDHKKFLEQNWEMIRKTFHGFDGE